MSRAENIFLMAEWQDLRRIPHSWLKGSAASVLNGATLA